MENKGIIETMKKTESWCFEKTNNLTEIKSDSHYIYYKTFKKYENLINFLQLNLKTYMT